MGNTYSAIPFDASSNPLFENVLYLIQSNILQTNIFCIHDDACDNMFISGDYGAWGDKAYCNDRLKNTIFIAEGLNNSTKDTIINIVDTDNGFYLESIKLSD